MLQLSPSAAQINKIFFFKKRTEIRDERHQGGRLLEGRKAGTSSVKSGCGSGWTQGLQDLNMWRRGRLPAEAWGGGDLVGRRGWRSMGQVFGGR